MKNGNGSICTQGKFYVNQAKLPAKLPIKLMVLVATTTIGLLPLFFGSCSQPSVPPNILLITLDTTRADHVDTGKGARAITPELRRFARQSVVFENAFCTIPQTLPSHVSLFTGHYPHQCGLPDNASMYDGRFPMLPEILRERGYDTGGIISLGTLSSKTGFPRGFDHFQEAARGKEVFFATAEQVTREAIAEVDKAAHHKKPFFLFVHYSDPHSPYAPPSVSGDFRIFVDDQEVAAINAHNGAILRMKVPLSPGRHRVRFQLSNHMDDFEAIVLRRLAFSKNCQVNMKGIHFSEKHYNGSHLMDIPGGDITVNCSGNGSMKLFQVIPQLNRPAATYYYRKEVEYMDTQLGILLRHLEKQNILKNTMVVITADHGEGLGERDKYFGHVRYLNRQFIHVPLIVYLPSTKPRRVSTPVSLIDIAPAILATANNIKTDSDDITAGSKEPDHGNNRILALSKGEKPNNQQPAICSFAFKPSAKEDKLSVISRHYQCIFWTDKVGMPAREFYDYSLSQSFRKIDEFHADIVNRHSGQDFHILLKTFKSMKDAFTSRFFARMKPVDRSQMEKLKAIGYLN